MIFFPISAFLCSECGAVYRLKQSFDAHLKSHQEKPKNVEPTFSCNQCIKKFNTRDQLKCHLLTHKKIVCELCLKTYSYTTLKAHQSNDFLFVFFIYKGAKK